MRRTRIHKDMDDVELTEVTGRRGTRGAGPFMYIHLHWRGGCVERASFETYGCPSAIRCGDWLTKWAVGRSAEVLGRIEPPDLEQVVGGLPPGKEDCAELAVLALRDALAQVYSQGEDALVDGQV